MLTLPAALFSCVPLLAIYQMACDAQAASSISGGAWLGIILFPVSSMLLLAAEYRAVCRREARAAAWVAGIFLYFAVCGSIGWVAGLLHLTGVLPPHRDWQSWSEFAIYSAFLAYMAFIGAGHLHWWRVLRASKPVAPIDWDT